MTNEPQGKIKFDATINLGHILTFIGFIGTGVAMWQTMDKRVVVLEEARAFQTSTDKRQDSTLDDTKKSVREDLREINNKLDRLIERK
jgi:hypothetical protein